jgi:hypothetical protein
VTFTFDGFHGRALYELNGLPAKVRDEDLVQCLLHLLEAPWDASPVHASSPAIRRAIFGDDGQGLITFLVNEETEKLRIIDILWLG